MSLTRQKVLEGSFTAFNDGTTDGPCTLDGAEVGDFVLTIYAPSTYATYGGLNTQSNLFEHVISVAGQIQQLGPFGGPSAMVAILLRPKAA